MANVTIGGNLNFNAIGNTKTTTTSTTKTQTTGLNGGWTASELRLSGTEDLGGGLRASFVAAVDLRNTTGWGPNRDTNVALSGGFGTVRIGRFVPATTMGYQGFSGAASVVQNGSIYGIGTGGSGAANFGAASTTVSLERNDNQIQYTTPTFNGFTANLAYSNNSSDSNATAATGKTRTEGTGFSVAYATGPLSIGAGTNQVKFETEAATLNACISNTGVISISTSTCPYIGAASNVSIAQSTGKSDLDWIGGSYNLGVATVMATQVKRKDTNAGAVASDISSTSLGVSVPMGAFTINASTYTGKNKLTSSATDNLKLSGHQLSVRYALSKRTTVYAAMGENKTKRDGGNTTGATRKVTSNAVGLMHSF